MIADFFKQSKPIVFIVLFSCLSLCFFLEVKQLMPEPTDLKSIAGFALKYISLITIFLIFISVLKQFEVQKRHSLGSFYFTLFSCLCIPFLIEGNVIYAFLFLSIGIYNCYKLINSSHSNLVLFQVVLFLFIAGLIEPTFILLLLMVSVTTFLFTTPKWRLFIIPVYAIATVIFWIECYGLFTTNELYGYKFFIQDLSVTIDVLSTTKAVLLFVLWGLVFLLFVYQFIKVKEKRAIFHRNNAKFFTFFLLTGVVSQLLTSPSIEKLWVLSIWPFSIYIADFVWRIRKRLWVEIFVLGSIATVLFMHLIF